MMKPGLLELPSSRREGFTIFIDNLPMSMTNVWLKQLFKNEGRILDVFVSRKQHKFEKELFRFVRFHKEHEANEAIKRNDELLVKGNKLKVQWSKYTNQGLRNKDDQGTQCKTTHK